MYLLKQIFFVYITFHVSKALPSVYSPEGISMSWTMNTTEELTKRILPKLIVDTFVGKNNHSFALLRCDNLLVPHPKRCDITIRTHSFNDQVHTKICKIHPPSEDQRDIVKIVGITFLRGDRLLVSWREKHKIHGWRRASSVVFADSCKESNFIYVNDQQGHFNPILRFKNYFEILFINPKINEYAKTLYCQVAYNYDGEPLNSGPLPFAMLDLQKHDPFVINSAYVMESDSKEGIVLTGRQPGHSILSEDVYSPIIGWIKADNLFYSHHVYSNTSGFATLCWIQNINYNFNCIWLDGTHKNVTLALPFERPCNKMPTIYNTPNGTIILINPGFGDDDSHKILVDEVDHVKNKCKRIAHIDVPKIYRMQNLHFSMPENDRICISYTTYTCNSDLCDKAPLLKNYHFTTRCARMNPANYKYVECSQDYWLSG